MATYYEEDPESFWTSAVTSAGAGALTGAALGGGLPGGLIGGFVGLGAGLLTARQQAEALEAEEERQQSVLDEMAGIDLMDQFGTAAGYTTTAVKKQRRAAIDLETRGLTGAQRATVRQTAETGIDEASLKALSEMLPAAASIEEGMKMGVMQRSALEAETALALAEVAPDPMAALGTAASMAATYGMQKRGQTGRTAGEQDVTITTTPTEAIFGEATAALEAPAIDEIGSWKDVGGEGVWKGVEYSLNPGSSDYTYTSPYTDLPVPLSEKGANSEFWGAARQQHVGAYQEQLGSDITEEELISLGLLMPRSQ